jgi:primosomal protein N' (replication factor Y)
MILRLAIASPLRSLFDYLPPSKLDGDLLPGQRVKVPFGRGSKIGLIISIETESQVPVEKLRAIDDVIDQQPLLDNELLHWLKRVNQYYQHAIGDTVFSALPTLLRQGQPAEASTIKSWRISESGLAVDTDTLKNARKQISLLKQLCAHPEGLNGSQIDEQLEKWRPSMKRLIEKGWASEEQQANQPVSRQGDNSLSPTLNDEQQTAVNAVISGLNGFQGFLLDGITGSGKTEVYLNIIKAALDAGKQALVLVPEIGLTPQLLQRFTSRFSQPIALMHSALNDTERLNNWLAAKNGHARIIIGTRSAIFSAFDDLGIIIIDEEHDASYKQHDGLRYHTRDIALMRAHKLDIPVLLGSATPSLESLHNCNQGRYQRLRLRQRAGAAKPPSITTLDLCNQPMVENMAKSLLKEAQRHLQRGNQVLLFLNRRGFSPTLICHSCGEIEQCRRCDTHMTLHQQSRRLCCHHCGSERPLPQQCPACGNLDVRPRGYGTERIEQALQEYFKEYEVIRIDRDTTRRKGSFDALLEKMHDGEGQILLGTQMLAKGHDFPNVTLVAILDADQGLFGSDFRATERLSQLITQVAGRAGRGEKPGKVVIQTHHPDHPLLVTLINQGFHAFAQAALQERLDAHFPPTRFAALIRAESTEPQQGMDVLEQLHELNPEQRDVELLGPVPAVIERRAGRYRAQLLLIAEDRRALHKQVAHIIHFLQKHPAARKVRWSVDIDPQDMN